MNAKKLLERVGRMEQIASIRRYVLDDGKGRGMRVMEVNNGSGLAFTVNVDRGLDIGQASFNGLPLAWMSRNGPVAPAFYNETGFEWLRTWPGGLLTSCGLVNVGGPNTTPEGEQGLHGRLDHTPAENVNTWSGWLDDAYVLEITGEIHHSKVFAENLVVSRHITAVLGAPAIAITDTVENCGYTEQPLMQLYHMNFGWPLVDACARLVAPKHKVTPQNARAEEGLAEWDKMLAPVPGFAEQVFYHDLPADKDGYATMRIKNPDLGIALAVSFRKKELPYLVQWRMMGQGEYVTGLEPANCYPEGQTAFGKRGLLRRIKPGEKVETSIRVVVEHL